MTSSIAFGTTAALPTNEIAVVKGKISSKIQSLEKSAKEQIISIKKIFAELNEQNAKSFDASKVYNDLLDVLVEIEMNLIKERMTAIIFRIQALLKNSFSSAITEMAKWSLENVETHVMGSDALDLERHCQALLTCEQELQTARAPTSAASSSSYAQPPTLSRIFRDNFSPSLSRTPLETEKFTKRTVSRSPSPNAMSAASSSSMAFRRPDNDIAISPLESQRANAGAGTLNRLYNSASGTNSAIADSSTSSSYAIKKSSLRKSRATIVSISNVVSSPSANRVGTTNKPATVTATQPLVAGQPPIVTASQPVNRVGRIPRKAPESKQKK